MVSAGEAVMLEDWQPREDEQDSPWLVFLLAFLKGAVPAFIVVVLISKGCPP
jgi:hypothetical protein